MFPRNRHYCSNNPIELNKFVTQTEGTDAAVTDKGLFHCFCCQRCADCGMTHLADLVEGVLSISSSVFEVVVSRKCPVDVPGDGAVLRGLLRGGGKRRKLGEEWIKRFVLREIFIPPFAVLVSACCSKNSWHYLHQLPGWHVKTLFFFKSKLL